MTLQIPLTGKMSATLISVYAPTMTNPDDIKDTFYQELDSVISSVPKSEKLIILGDFNARVGTDHQIWDGILGVHGCGSEIYVFDFTTNKLEMRQQVLAGASVHGIRLGPTDPQQRQLLCVYGAKQARVVSIEVTNHNEDVTFLSDIREFSDWIWDVHWLIKEPKDDSIALALAHNSVLRWDWQSGTILSQRDCVEKCILYCSHFIGNTWENLVIAAGTVFNEIVLWPVSSNNQTDSEPVEVMHTFSGHQGVIFSIRYHQSLQRLCSASDDRSIRMWQLIFPNQTEPTLEDWKHVRSDLLLLVYGHSARVWDVALTSTYFASVGEDAICCIWNYTGNILHKFKGHKGRSIWRVTTTEDEKFVITGGGDASIRMWEVHQEKTKKTFQRIVSVPASVDTEEDYFPRIVKVLNFDIILIMMNSGDLYSYSLSEQRFSLLVSDGKFRSYSILSPCPDQMTLALGSITGDVRIFQLPEMPNEEIKYLEMSLFSGKVLALTWLDRYHFLASGPGGISLLHRVEAVQDSDTEDTLLCMKMLYHLALPPSKHRWITAACLIPAAEADLKGISHLFIICGDKDGSVHCYNLSDGETCSDGPNIKLLQPSKSFFRVHGKAGVTFVCYRDGIVYTAGRDGFYRQWKIQAGNISQLCGNKIVKGFDWIDRLEWYNNDLLVYGFFSSLFVVWSVSYNQQLMSVHCGGGHRAWGCCHDNEMLRFAYLKAGKVYVVDSGHQAKQIIVQAELHGRKLCDVKFITLLSEEKDKPIHVVCSAGEDTIINIGAFANTNNLYSWRPITALKGHMSSVRALAVSSCSIFERKEYSEKAHLKDPLTSEKTVSGDHFILFSGGGRAEIRAWKFNINKDSFSQNLVAPTLASVSLKETNFTCDKVQSSHSNSLHCDTGLDECTEDLSVPHSNNILDVTPGQSVMSSMSGITALGADQIQCNYQHLSTVFLGEPHRRFRVKMHKLRLDPETRVMSLAASSLAFLSNQYQDNNTGSDTKVLMTEDMQRVSRVHILSCAGSDGVFRVFAFDEHSRIFSSLAESTYHRGCVLKVLHYVHYFDSHHHQSFAVSASTNGAIVFWPLGRLVTKLVSNILSIKQPKSSMDSDIEKISVHEEGDSSIKAGMHYTEYYEEDDNDDKEGDIPEETIRISINEERNWEPVSSLKAHQSGVNSLHALQVSESQLLVASGGDDNAITIQLLEISDSCIKVMAKVTKGDAHAAQVTGIHLVSATLVVSASIDQRVCVWSIKQAPNFQIQIQLVACKYVDVADISSMSVYLHKDSVYMNIAGEGLCLYRLSTADGIS